MEKKIVINIKDDGSLQAETFGMVGAECLDELNKLMKDVATSVDIKKKPEFFKSKNNQHDIVENKNND